MGVIFLRVSVEERSIRRIGLTSVPSMSRCIPLESRLYYGIRQYIFVVGVSKMRVLLVHGRRVQDMKYMRSCVPRKGGFSEKYIHYSLSRKSALL